jgi:hypothetical protein
MALENTNKVDFVKVPRTDEDKTILVINDTGTVIDPNQRFSLMCSKLAHYYHVLESEEFSKIYPGAERNNSEIHIYCTQEPTEQMQNIEKLVKPSNDMVVYPIKYIVKRPLA